MVLEAIPRLSSEALLSLLEASFAFIGISELRAVPLAVLSHMHPVPEEYLVELAKDREMLQAGRCRQDLILQRLPPSFPWPETRLARVVKELANPVSPFCLGQDLPLGVRRQIFEIDRPLLQIHALPLLSQYAAETATVLRALDADEGCPST